MKQKELIYGIHAVNSILHHNPDRILKLFIAKGRDNARLKELLAEVKHHHIHIEPRDRKDLDAITHENVHQGVVAECRTRVILSEDDLSVLLDNLEEPPFLLILDGVQDPHNLGACMRTADAVGVDAVIVPKDRSTGLTATAQKVASGAAESVPFIQVTNLARTLRMLRERNIWVFGLDERAKTTFFEANLNGPIALVLGGEGKGLRHLTEQHCDALHYLPMIGVVSSLNLAVATGVCLFEAVRQRSF